MDKYIFCINFGSTSSKFALYNNDQLIAEQSISHSKEELSKCSSINEQLPLRQSYAETFLEQHHMSVKDLSAIAARAGVTPPVDFGAYMINDCMVDRLFNHPLVDHAMNLTPVVAYRLAQGTDILVMTYDSCTTDQMEPVYKISGIPEIERSHMCHTENIRAVAFKTAKKLQKNA